MILEECADKLRKLEASQTSIVDTSDTLLRISLSHPHLTPCLSRLWSRLLLLAHKQKKVAFVYLANDLLQKSLLHKNPAYHLAFEPMLPKVLLKLFEQCRGEAYTQVKVDILKVVKVWLQRQIYAQEMLTALRDKLMLVGGVTEEELTAVKTPASAKKSAVTGGISAEQFRGGYEVQGHWAEMAESLRFLDENRGKLRRLEEQMEGGLGDMDEIEMECRVNEYKNLVLLQKTYERDLLKQPLKLFNKIENSNVQAVLTLNRIDEALNRTIRLKLQFRR